MGAALKDHLTHHLLEPIRAMRWRYLPLLAIYFAYGCSAFSGIGESFFVKEHLNLSAAALLTIGVWLGIPWTIKMVFGQFVDSIPIFGSPRKSYIYIAAVMMSCGSILMAGLAGQWSWVSQLGSANEIYVVASLVTIIGVVLQDVVADAMSVEVVERDGRSEEEINRDLAKIQLLGRLALSIGLFAVAGLGGWIAQVVTYQTLFLLTLIIPLISISGAFLVKIDTPDRQPINWNVLIGGFLFGVFAVTMGLSHIPYKTDIVFIVSLIVIIYLLRRVTYTVEPKILKTLVAAAIVIFAFRATPSAGPGVQWWTIDVLGFDKAFFGTLAQIGAGLAIVGMWFFARSITEKPVAKVLFWLTIIYFALSLPMIGLYYGLHEWTLTHFGFGARTIALIDTALGSPFAQLAMIPMLALIARNAPRGNAATWFALMASLMNLALTAGTLLSKYLNHYFSVSRAIYGPTGQLLTAADYSQLGHLMIIATTLSLLLPVIAILIFMRQDLLR